MSNQPAPNNAGYAGTRDDESDASEFNAQVFMIQQLIGRVATATLVSVVSVTNAGDVSPVGFVDVHPLVKQTDGLGNSVQHGTIYRIPYFRMQGGANAIIIDPQIGDIGICLFADHDISIVKSTAAEATPGSRRRFDMADGLYIGGVLNGTPTQYVRFSSTGIEIVSPTVVTVTAPDVHVNGSSHIYFLTPHLVMTGNLEIDGDLKVTGTVEGGP